jgi:hypothetical protein
LLPDKTARKTNRLQPAHARCKFSPHDHRPWLRRSLDEALAATAPQQVINT